MNNATILQESVLKSVKALEVKDIENIVNSSRLSKNGRKLVNELLSSKDLLLKIVDIVPLKNDMPNEEYIDGIRRFINKFLAKVKVAESGKEIKAISKAVKSIMPYAASDIGYQKINEYLSKQEQVTNKFANILQTYVKKSLDLKVTETQGILIGVSKKTGETKKLKETVSYASRITTEDLEELFDRYGKKAAIKKANRSPSFKEAIKRQEAIINKNLGITPIAKNTPEVKKAVENVEKIAEVAKEATKTSDTVKKGAEAAKTTAGVVKTTAETVKKGADATKNAVQETVKAISGGKSKIISKVTVAVAALAAVPLIAGWREKSSIAKVKEITENALNSKNYKDLVKYISVLKNMQAKNTLIDKLMVADSASKLAGVNLEAIKKSYTVLGATLIASSIVICLLVGITGQVISSLKEMVSNFSFNSVINTVTKLAFLGILLAPALIGICLIKVAQDGFTEEGPAAFIVSMLSPVVSLSNYCIKGVLELIENAEKNQINGSINAKYINNINSDKANYINTLKKLKYQIDVMLIDA